MNKIFIVIILIVVAGLGTLFFGSEVSKEEKLTEMQEISFVLGYSMGMNLPEHVDAPVLIRGVAAGQEEKEAPRYSKEEMQHYLNAYQMRLREDDKKKRIVQAQKNLKRGVAYRNQYLTHHKAEAKTLPEGVIYRVIKEGSGPIPAFEDTVLVSYMLKTVDGKVIQDRSDDGKPVALNVGRTIKGWQIALKKMAVGSTWELVIPPALAYGEKGIADAIGPNETLIFEVTLLEIRQETEQTKEEEVVE